MRSGPIRLTDRAHTALRPATAARITDGFWATRRRTNSEVSIPRGPAQLERAGNLANLRAAAAGSGEFAGDFPFQDSDVHKWLEAASWQLAEEPGDGQLMAHIEELTALLASAQDPDGYLQTYYQVVRPDRRWQELGWGHELYCAGHLIQAAIALHRTTGNRQLLDVAERFAVHIHEVFAQRADGVCGHPEIETALVELYRETGERRWLELAAAFVDRRGHGALNVDLNPHLGRAYWQDHTPVREATSVAGHAVRQLYLLAGVADLAAETGAPELRATAERLWDHMVATKTYLTGGVGARHEGEAFGEPYELPPDRAYAETCAAIASIQWSWRMALLTGEAKYSDLIERTLYNGFLSGVGLDGDSWLYVNPLQVREEYEGANEADKAARRTPWFRCACCPPNVMRLLASLPHYLVSGDGQGLQLHQYATGVYEAGGGRVRVATQYPWDGRIEITVEEAPERDWTLSVRIPSWCTGFTATAPNSDAPTGDDPGWLRLRRRWTPGDTLTVNLDLSPRLTGPDPRVDAVRGCLAIERGPLVHCLEGVDQEPGVPFDELTLPDGAELSVRHEPGLLGGVSVVTAAGRRRGAEAVVRLTAVPYHAWANRRPGAMRVWVPRE